VALFHVSVLPVAASRNAAGRTTLTLTNRHRSESLAVRVRGLAAAQAQQITAASTESTQTTLSHNAHVGEVITLPAASVTALTF
jgi:hypothetical protein